VGLGAHPDISWPRDRRAVLAESAANDATVLLPWPSW
jgi:hypothetical protein